MKLDCLIIQFAKLPELGKVKTRLASKLGNNGCLELHKKLVGYVNQTLLTGPVFHMLAFNKLEDSDWLKLYATHTPVMLQQGDGLGARMKHAITWGLTRANKVIIVGSDCPVLSHGDIEQVVTSLERHDHCFIPAEDGGYVLIAATEVFDPIFQNMPWGTDKVLKITQQKLIAGNKQVEYLSSLWDVDRPEDYERLIKVLPHLAV